MRKLCKRKKFNTKLKLNKKEMRNEFTNVYEYIMLL